jgi:hypothetical protein
VKQRRTEHAGDKGGDSGQDRRVAAHGGDPLKWRSDELDVQVYTTCTTVISGPYGLDRLVAFRRQATSCLTNAAILPFTLKATVDPVSPPVKRSQISA